MLGTEILKAYRSAKIPEGARIVNVLSQPVYLNTLSAEHIYFVFFPMDTMTRTIHIDSCTHDSAWNAAFIQMIEQSPCPTGVNTDTLNAYLAEHDNQLYTGVSILPDMPAAANVRVKSALDQGFFQMKISDLQPPASHISIGHGGIPARTVSTTLDSMKMVVNYVYTKYIYSQHTEVASSNIDSLANLLETGNLAGDCGDTTHYLNMIITQYFPWWGTGIELNSNSATFLPGIQCSVSHVFLGLADTTGKIGYVLDATINGVWCDSLTGKALSLDSAEDLLKAPIESYRVVKRNSLFFGQHNSGIGDLSTPCVLGLEYAPGELAGVSASGVAPSDTFWVISPWAGSQFDAARPTAKYAYYWNQLGFPTNNWANNLLIIVEAACYDPIVAALVSQKYGFQVNPIQ